MSTLDITRSYLDGEILFASDLDAIIDAVELFLNTTKLTDDNIADGGITGSLKLVSASVTNAKLAASAVGTTNIVDAAVTTAKINTSAVTTAKINDGAVTAAKLATDSIDSANILDGAVTRAKLAAPNYVLSTSGTGSFSTTSGSVTAVTNATVTITKTGRPVLILLVPDESTTNARITISDSSYTAGVALEGSFYLYKDSTVYANIYLTFTYPSGTFASHSYGPGTLMFVDTSGTTGSTVYALRCSAGGGATVAVQYSKLFAIEL